MCSLISVSWHQWERALRGFVSSWGTYSPGAENGFAGSLHKVLISMEMSAQITGLGHLQVQGDCAPGGGEGGMASLP